MNKTFFTKDFAFLDSEGVELWLNSFTFKIEILAYVSIAQTGAEGQLDYWPASLSITVRKTI